MRILRSEAADVIPAGQWWCSWRDYRAKIRRGKVVDKLFNYRHSLSKFFENMGNIEGNSVKYFFVGADHRWDCRGSGDERQSAAGIMEASSV